MSEYEKNSVIHHCPLLHVISVWCQMKLLIKIIGDHDLQTPYLTAVTFVWTNALRMYMHS